MFPWWTLPESRRLSNIRYPDSQRKSHPLDYIFHPESIAIVGISADLTKIWIKQLYVDSLLKGGYDGRIYLVNPRGGEMMGFPIYRSLLDIPGPVDHVIVSVPAPYTPAILEECCHKGVKVVHVFASGYAETGEPERIRLQNRLQEIAKRGNIRIIGPNCLGIYYPKGKIGLSPDFPLESGPVGYLSQSGGNVTYMVRHALARGLRFSKVVSYGNACDINECDLLDYLAEDSETEVIAAYIEGTSDGQRLVAALNKAASAKPVVVFKGGYTDGGLRAASSHTGALAGADTTWDALLRQAGAIRVDSIEEMVDMLVALLRVSPPKGPNTCVVGHGGGASVMVTDELERVGLRLTPVPEEIRERLKQFIDLANSMLRNPIDAGPLVPSDGFELVTAMGDRTCIDLLRERASTELGGGWGQLNAALKDWRDLDLVVFQHGFDVSPIPVSNLTIGCEVGPMILAAKAYQLPKAVVLHSMGNDDTWQASAELRALCVEFGLPLFLSVRGAGLALRKLIDYNRAYPDRLASLHH
jgi:succinyl-CoA synthetase alpha subunit